MHRWEPKKVTILLINKGGITDGPRAFENLVVKTVVLELHVKHAELREAIGDGFSTGAGRISEFTGSHRVLPMVWKGSYFSLAFPVRSCATLRSQSA